MEARKYTPADLSEINTWCQKRNIPGFPEDLLPKTGFVVPGIAAAFLYKTDSHLAYIDCCVSNPEAPRTQRREALTILMEDIIEESRVSGYRVIMTTTLKKTIKDICEQFKFKDIGSYTTFIKEIL